MREKKKKKLLLGNVDDDATYIYDIFGFIQFTVFLPHAVCSLQSAVCGLRSAVCGLRSAVCGLQSAVCKCHTPELRLVVAIVYLLNIAGFRETSVRDNDLCRYRSIDEF